MSDSKEAAQSFHLKEFELLKDEIKRRSDEQTNTEKLAIFSCAAIYTLIATISKEGGDEFKNVILILWWIPPILIFYALIRWQANDDTIQTIGLYIKHRLEVILAKNGRGWETCQGELHCSFRAYEYKDAKDSKLSFLHVARNLRRSLIYDKKGNTKIWLIMETIRAIILVATVGIAMIQTVFHWT